MFRFVMKQTLTNKEEMLMNIFWKHGSLFIRDVISYLPEPSSWKRKDSWSGSRWPIPSGTR